MADRTTRPIEAVRVGDRVLAYDPDGDQGRGRLADTVVTKVLVHLEWSAPMVRVNGIRVTANHRFYVDGDWIHAGELELGDALLTLDVRERTSSLGGTVTSLIAEPETPGAEPVYNLEVEAYHDYFAGGVLVHNGGKTFAPERPRPFVALPAP
jgi:intein/homing endonuclease